MSIQQPATANTTSAGHEVFEGYAAKFTDSTQDIKSKLQAACDIRDSVDQFGQAEAQKFSPVVLPAMLQVLRETPPAFKKDSSEHQLRNAILEVFHRLPVSEQMKPIYSDMVSLTTQILREDNEENGVLAVKIMLDANRTFKRDMDPHVQGFLDFVRDLYLNMKQTVTELLSEDSRPAALAVKHEHQHSSSSGEQPEMLRAIASFKVLTECPIATVYLFQMHRNTIPSAVKSSIPLAMDFLQLQAPPQKHAHDEANERNEHWIGVSPAIKHRAHYIDFITAQVKTLSFVAYVLRGAIESPVRQYGEIIPPLCVRLLKDCPPESANIRRELMVATRHILSTEFRPAFVPLIDCLTSEHILIGTGVNSQETSGLSHIACLVTWFTTFAKSFLQSNFAESFIYIRAAFTTLHAILEKYPKPEAASTLLALLETCVDKLGAVWAIHQQVANANKEALGPKADTKTDTKADPHTKPHETKDVEMHDIDAMDIDAPRPLTKTLSLVDIERSKPVQAAAFALENKGEAAKESKVLFRTLLHVFKTVLAGIRTSEGPVPDGELIRRLFQNCVKCLTMYDDGRDGGKEAFEMLLQVFHEIEPHIFQEVWTTEMQFFIDHVQDHQNLLAMPQLLLSSDMVSHQLVAILLRYLVGKLDTLGDQSQKSASITLRLFKMCFMSVTVFPELNEPILFHHLSKLIMDSLRLAAKAADPTNYFLLLRGLFRAMGAGTAEPSKQDLLVELCLTVPVRLTNLLPFLGFLMRPLVHALRAGPELVAQGLRTLELCIDNLTQEFLDPTLSPVLRELMSALHSHLKPQPGNHQHAHTTVRILGKLVDEIVDYSINSLNSTVDIGPTCQLAIRLVQESNAFYRQDAFTFIQRALELFMRDVRHGWLEHIYFADIFLGYRRLEDKAAAYIREFSEIVFLNELSQNVGNKVTKITSLYMDRVPRLLAATSKHHVERGQVVFGDMLNDLLAFETKAAPVGRKLRGLECIVHPLGFNLTAACYEETWPAKLSGCRGIIMLADALGPKWTSERENSFIRAFLSVLKEMPADPPREVEFIKESILKILRLCRQAPPFVPPPQPGMDPASLPKLPHLVPTLTTELSSPIALVREMAQKSIELLAELTESTPSELLMKCKERLLTPIFAKPLRALPISLQIGHIDGITYALNMKPPLPEMNEELLRLLSEALAIADAEDRDIVGPGGRGGPRSNAAVLEQLRVVCIKLLTSSMSVTEFFAKQMATRQKVTSVYFKSLYSPSNEVKKVAHEGLRTVLNHQSRLPKDILQTGLRPVLMNLADAKRLSVPGLEGLARLLELLTNYFKVEIGHKLLDHFRVIADPKMLSDAAYQPLADNEEITKLVRLVNIFHLLPPAANMFLEALVSLVVQVETQLHSASPSPFTAALASFLDRFPSESSEYFYRSIGQAPTLRSLRNVISSGLAPNLNAEFRNNTKLLVDQCLKDETNNLVLPGLILCTELSADHPTWLQEHPEVLDALLHLWRSHFLHGSEDNFVPVEGFARHVSHVTLGASSDLRKQIMQRFVEVFDGDTYNWAHKSQFLRHIVNPLLYAQIKQKEESESPGNTIDCVDSSIVNGLHSKIWKPMTDQPSDPFPGSDDGLKIEILHMSSLLIQSSSSLMQESRKDVIKCTWHYIVNDDATVKQTAYVTISQFFAVFDSPPKFLTGVWTGLLRPVHTDNRSLTKQAVDIMVPVLIKAGNSENGPPSWAKSVRRALIDEGHSIPQLLVIHQIIVRHPEFFYPCRELFVPSMISSLHKLGTVQTATAETRANALDVLEVILSWERRAVKESKESGAGGSSSAWVLPFSMRETIISYLVRFITMTSLEADKLGLPSRALGILESILKPGGWKDVDVQLQYFHRPLLQVDLNEANHLPVIVNATKVFSLIVLSQDDNWLLSHAADLHTLIEKGLRSDEPTLHEYLQPVLQRMLALVGEPVEGESSTPGHAIFSFADSMIKDGLQHSQRQLAGTYACLSVLKTMVAVYPAKLEVYAPHLVKVLQKLVKDHNAANPTNNPVTSETTSRLVTLIFEICRDKVSALGVERRWFLNAVILVVGHSQTISLCHYVLGMVREWTLVRPDVTPTLKEKAGMLKHMMGFESRNDTKLLDDYLNLIYDIYTEPSLKRSDLTTRLESVFLMGCRAKDPAIRCKFVDLFDTSIQRTVSARLQYALGSLSWEFVAEHYWIPLALDLVLGATEDGRTDSLVLRENLAILESSLSRTIYQGTGMDMLQPLRRLLHADNQVAHELWISTFRAVWATLPRREQSDAARYVLTLVTKDYHSKQCDLRPNVIQSILGGVHACNPPLALPPFVVKYLGKTFNAWHIALEILQSGLDPHRAEEPHETTYDALAELYAELSEDDLFYGLWRRRSIFEETNAALAYEQNGFWSLAQQTYESAQIKARTGALPFNESEYCLWEDHWILATQKLQQWDPLAELARSENNADLQLECIWRTTGADREQIQELLAQVSDVPTPRRRVFEAYVALTQIPPPNEKNMNFLRIMDESIQLSLRKWVTLPSIMSMAHVPLLQHFQQFVELQEAAQIFMSLSMTNAQNLEKRSSELKVVLQAWRERLPNLWDDISLWSDLVAWRTHVFEMINKTYVPLIPTTSASGSSGNSNTYGYRGYHETAWIINRFAHVARKHQLPDVCHTSLAKIYTLPNIEISEAFLKLREQARCHYHNPNTSELTSGLEVINNTNLMYFNQSQKAEFYTLKGMFIAKLGNKDDADRAFQQAVQMDMGLAKAWGEWGKFNDRQFKERPQEYTLAANAVQCYLHAASLHKSAKSRPIIQRIIWLLSVEEPQQPVISPIFEGYKGDIALWYWLTIIPQLLVALSYRESKHARHVLMSISKHYPQALFFHLRTTREEFVQEKKRLTAMQNARNARQAQNAAAAKPDGTSGTSTTAGSPPTPKANGPTPDVTTPAPTPGGGDTAPSSDVAQAANTATMNALDGAVQRARQPFDHVEDVTSILKTGFPLLTLALETMVDQIAMRMKLMPEEDICRQLSYLHADGMMAYNRRCNSLTEDNSIPQQSQMMAANFARGLQPPNARAAFEQDILMSKLTLRQYVVKVQKWRDRYDSQPDHSRTPHKDSPHGFIRIQRFASRVDFCRSLDMHFRRIGLHGHDGSFHTFAVQTPTARHARREERGMQLFRSFNASVLDRRKETRKRNLNFHLPAAVSLSSTLRLLENDASYITMQDMLEQHFKEKGIHRDDPQLHFLDKLKTLRNPEGTKVDFFTLRAELISEISAKLVPANVITNYMTRCMRGPMELWTMRKLFALQVAASSFMSFFFSANGRMPQRFHISRSTGRMFMSDLLPTWNNKHPIIHNAEAVPFRFTPNMQHFVTPIGIEGLMTSGMMAIARGLTEPEYDLEQQLTLFLRDEVFTWCTTAQNTPPMPDLGFRRAVQHNAESLVKKAELMACRTQADTGASTPQVPIQNITDLIIRASQEQQLAQMEITYLPWIKHWDLSSNRCCFSMSVYTKARDMRGTLKHRYTLLGSDRLWESLDEVSVLGCVNAMSWSSDGELLFSSGDDTRLLVWKHDPRHELAQPLPLDAQDNCLNLRCVNAIKTGHTNNVFAAKQLAPNSSLVGTCARDSTVRVFDIERAGGTNMPNRGYGRNEAGAEARLHLFKCHTKEVKRIATEQSQSTFLTVAGGHLFDRRMVGRDLKDERGDTGVKGQDLVACVARFGRDAEREAHDRGAHVTGARMARSNGDEATYSGDAVYRYSIYDTPSESAPRQTSIVPNNDSLERRDANSARLKSSESSTCGSTNDDEESNQNPEEESEEESDSSDEDDEEMPLQSGSSYGNHAIILPRSEYRGAANVRTVKDVNFLGKSDEFVTSGSDDGNWFLWNKKSGRLLGIWEGDGSVVNVIEGHPFLPIVAVSGIDDTIKIFEPKAGNKRKSHIQNSDDILQQNAESNEHPSLFGRAEMIATLRMLQATGRIPDLAEGIESVGSRLKCGILFPILGSASRPSAGQLVTERTQTGRQWDHHSTPKPSTSRRRLNQELLSPRGSQPRQLLDSEKSKKSTRRSHLLRTVLVMDESWESSSRKRARAEPDEYRRDHLAYEHGSHSLPREHLRRTPDHYTTDPQPWERRRVSEHHWHTTRDQYQKDAPIDDLESSHDHSTRPIYTPHRPNGSSSSYHRTMSRPHHSRIDRPDSSLRHESREWIPRDAVAKRGESWSSKPEEPRPEPSAGMGDRTWTASEGWTRENSKSANAARGYESRHSPPPRTHIPQAKVYNRSSHHTSTSWRDVHDSDYTSSRRHQNGGPSRVGEGWRERQVRRDRDSSHRFTERRDKNPTPQRRTIINRKWTERSAYSPPAEPRGVSKRRHSSYSPSPSRKTDRSRSPVRSISRTPSRSKSRSPARSWHRTRTPSRSRSRSRSISSRSLDSRSRSRSRSPGRRRTAINRPRSRSPDRWDYRNKKRKNQRGGNTMLRQTSEFEETGRPIPYANTPGDAVERRRTEAAKRPVHRLPESSRSKALENSPTAPQRLNGFNQQKPRPPSSPVSFRAPNAMSRALAPETDTPAAEITAALANGLHLPTSTIPTGPRSMAQVSQPQINSHPDVAVVSPNKPLTTSPITLKVQQSKAPSRTVKMFFPGDEDDEEAPGGAESSSRSTNLVPPVKDKDSGLTLPPGSQKSEFIPAKDHSTSGVPPVADLSPQRRLNGVPGPSVSTSPKSTFTSTQQAPITPSLARVARDEDYKTAASMPPGPIPPPQHLAFAPENKVLRAVASSSSTIPRRPPNIPKTASEYQIICQVGEGTFGKVYKARSLANPDARVALKRIRMEGEKDGFPVTAMREIKLLQSLRHENVINLHEMMVSKVHVYPSSPQIAMRPDAFWSRVPAPEERDTSRYEGSNILLNNYGELKLADFGWPRFYSKRRRSDYTNRVITLWYRPPELLLGATVYGPEVDMWSAGVSRQRRDPPIGCHCSHNGHSNIEMWPGLTDMPWFELVKPTEPVKSHFRSIFNKYLSPAALDLAELLLAYDPNKRTTAVQALQAPYFVSEDPPPEKPVGLATIEGEWHEYESKREREKLRKKRKVEGQHQQHQQ
ncbi:PI3 PI4-kinase family [Rhizoctonia solani]|uniref:PI3 PI4-kinase family n=1 Tax=Rhizoctonia solani TaxID=456999 RepID=A0A8H7M846_9AGAM|nr:PI3 PI4-kinase family [Rhizoctonia solani]